MALANIKWMDFKETLEALQGLSVETILVIVDEHLWPIYKEKLPFDALPGKEVYIWRASDGENTKNLTEYTRCLEFFLEKAIRRDAYLVALGGGALHDFAGMIAATLLGGIAWTAIPTTMVSMIHPPFTGEVSLNSRFGENLIGLKYPPQEIWINLDFLKTLPPTQMSSGRGELLRQAFLSKDVAEAILQQAPLAEQIKLALAAQTKILQSDGGQAALLKLGSLLQRALEKTYSLSYGPALAEGLYLSFCLAGDQAKMQQWRQLQAVLLPDLKERPWSVGGFSPKKILTYLGRDKQAWQGAQLQLILPTSAGLAPVAFNMAQLEDAFEKISLGDA